MGWGSVEKCGKRIEDVYMLTGVATPVANTSLIQGNIFKKIKKTSIYRRDLNSTQCRKKMIQLSLRLGKHWVFTCDFGMTWIRVKLPFTRHLKQMWLEWVALKVLTRQKRCHWCYTVPVLPYLTSRTREWKGKEGMAQRWQVFQSAMLNVQKYSVGGSRGKAFGSGGAAIQNQWMNYWYAPQPHA